MSPSPRAGHCTPAFLLRSSQGYEVCGARSAQCCSLASGSAYTPRITGPSWACRWFHAVLEHSAFSPTSDGHVARTRGQGHPSRRHDPSAIIRICQIRMPVPRVTDGGLANLRRRGFGDLGAERLNGRNRAITDAAQNVVLDACPCVRSLSFALSRLSLRHWINSTEQLRSCCGVSYDSNSTRSAMKSNGDSVD